MTSVCLPPFQIPETIPDTVIVRVLVLLRTSTGVRVGDSPLNMGWRALPGPAMGVKTAHRSTGAMDSMGIVAFYIPILRVRTTDLKVPVLLLLFSMPCKVLE